MEPVLAVVAAMVVIGLAAWAWTERSRHREAQTGLASSRARSSELETRLGTALQGLEALAEGVVVLDAQGRALYVNGAARELLGRRVSGVSDLAPSSLRGACHASLQEGRGAELEFESAGRTLQAAVVPDMGRTTVLILRDVTAARRSDRD